MRKKLLLNPLPRFGEILQTDRWLKENQLGSTDVEFRFDDLDGDGDPTIPDIGVRMPPPVVAEKKPANPSRPLHDLSWLTRHTWRAMRDQADGSTPSREARLMLLTLMLDAARVINQLEQLKDKPFLSSVMDGKFEEAFPGFHNSPMTPLSVQAYAYGRVCRGDTTASIHDGLSIFDGMARDIRRRTQDAERQVASRAMANRIVPYKDGALFATYLQVGSEFDSGAAFRAMEGLEWLISHDARDVPSRTAVLAKRTLDLTDPFKKLFERLNGLEPGCWELVPSSNPTPMILPARRSRVDSRLGADPKAMFDLLQSCAA